MFLGTRVITTTYVYDDPEHPTRPTASIPSPTYTDEDRALLLALAEHEASLCACGEPRVVAWHGEMDGFYEHDGFVCHACTVRQGRQVVYGRLINTRPDSKGPMPPFQMGVTTTAPDDQPAPSGRGGGPTDTAIG